MIIEQFLTLIIKLIESFIKFIVELIKFAITAIPEKKEGYNAKFVWSGTLLSGNHKGFCLTGRKNLSVKNSYQNSIIIGGTGTGKSSVVLLPSIYTTQGSLIIHDPSGELFFNSAGYLKQKGYEIKVLNFANPDKSSNYNPLERAKSSSHIQKVATMLVENALGGKSKDPFWNTQATALMAMLIAILIKQETVNPNLYNVRQLLNKLGGDPEYVDNLFSKYADEALFGEYKSFISYDAKVVSGVIATCKAALQIFSDEAVAQVTSCDNINFEEFRNKPTALYIQNSVADQKYYSVLTSIYFEQFFAYILSRFPEENENDIFLLIDEASSLYFPTLPLAVANVRKHKSGIMLLVQDFSQIVHSYGKENAEGIKSNCFAKMYFTGTSLDTSKELEQTLGKYQYQDDKKNNVVRSLMTNDEIRTMKENKAILICGHHKPIIARLKPFYKRMKFRKYSMIEIPDITTQALDNQTLLNNQTPDEQENE
ncbi:MAG: type IV secretory system conjugative DNA transfer family protein [Bacteroidota bacterium]